MTDTERLALNAAGNPAGAVEELFQLPRLAVKFFEPVFAAPLDTLPSAVDFKAQLPAELRREGLPRYRKSYCALQES